MKQLELATAASSPAFSQARLGCRVLHCNITDMAVGDCCTIPIQAGTFLGCRVSGRLPADTANNFIVHFGVQGMVRPMSRWLIPGLVCARTCCRKTSSKPTMFDVHLEAGSFGRAAGRCFEHDGISCLRSPMQADTSSARHPPHITYNITSSMVAGDSLLTSQAARRQRRRHLSGAADMLTGASSQLIDCAAVPAAQHRRWNLSLKAPLRVIRLAASTPDIHHCMQRRIRCQGPASAAHVPEF